jgi:hypothetical protein
VGQVRLWGAEIRGSLVCDGGKFQNPVQPGAVSSGVALDAVKAKVGGNVHLNNEFSAEGQVRLRGAESEGTWIAPTVNLRIQRSRTLLTLGRH